MSCVHLGSGGVELAGVGEYWHRVYDTKTYLSQLGMDAPPPTASSPFASRWHGVGLVLCEANVSNVFNNLDTLLFCLVV